MSSNDSGGLISVNSANSNAAAHITNTLDVNSGASLTALGTVSGGGNVTVSANSHLQPVTIASSGSGGLFAGGSGGTFAAADYSTNTNMDGTIVAANNAAVEAHTSIDGATATITADVGGLGVGASTNALICIGSNSTECRNAETDHNDGVNQVDIQGSASITGNHIAVNAVIDHLDATLSTRTHATALGASSEATGTADIAGTTQVLLESGSSFTGNVSTSFDAEYQDINLHVTADASCSCLGGETDSTATITDTSDARVSGFSGSTIKTSDLTVTTNQNVIAFSTSAPNSGGFLDFGNDGDTHSTPNLKRDIFWESRVIMLGEPDPWFEVDAAGNITKLVNVCGHDDVGHTFCDDPFTGTHVVPQLSGTTITLDDIVYDHGAQARFLANDLSGTSGAPAGEIWGDLGSFEFQQTWDYVEILNHSFLNLITNVIDVVDTLNSPVIDVRVDHINDDGADSTYSTSAGNPPSTFDFNIKYTFPPTLVQIENTWPSGNVSTPYIQLNNYIENPIGTTQIVNASGDILASGPPHPTTAVIRTNVLILTALHGTIGARGPPDNARGIRSRSSSSAGRTPSAHTTTSSSRWTPASTSCST